MVCFSFIELTKDLPPIIARQKVSEYFGGAISAKTLANLDSLGQGPEGAFRVGRTIVYPTPSLLAWLQHRSNFISPGGVV
ncbi:hypothetical protein [Desulfobacter latus]|uniref:DNA-binding protein n=1 Tax=Desulfobacter latus TaxID=2292 RepID=A0A850T099_9BACT|nr:hypothetical protein [Desulfobacter latus]NWH06954.1 hypothetical protein [Desulfobacter latus]